MNRDDIVCLRFSLFGRRFFCRLFWSESRHIRWLPSLLVGYVEKAR
jgi:hypothetical protein